VKKREEFMPTPIGDKYLNLFILFVFIPSKVFKLKPKSVEYFRADSKMKFKILFSAKIFVLIW